MAESPEEKSPAVKQRNARGVRWSIGLPIALVLILFMASFYIDEPLRRLTEENINRNLKGYTVQLPKLHLRLIDLAVTVEDVSVLQQSHPNPPVAHLPMVKTTIHWKEILSGKLVAEVLVDQPKININLQQLRSEAASVVPMQERGWQQALEEIYPLKINTMTINDASITYIDEDPAKPLVLSHLNFQASNIRNIHLPEQVYPSSFHLDTAIFNSGQGRIDGNANFLDAPIPGIKARFEMEKLPLDFFKSVMARANLSINGGLLTATGDVEYAPTVKNAHLKNLEIQGMKIDYIHSQRTAVAEKERAVVVGKTVKEVSNKSDLLIRVDQVSLIGCTIGLVNKTAKKPYRIFFTDTDFQLKNFSNQFARGPVQAQLKAQFMGSGKTVASGDFRPEKNGPDFDLYIKIEETKLTTMNDLLRTYGNFDVVAGSFSLITELHVKNGDLSGYVKPFFKDMDVYDRRQDKEQGFTHKLYEKLVGGAAGFFENRPRQEVATKADLSGPVENPETNTWQIVGEVIKNAFFKAILPTFEREAATKEKR